MRRIEKIQNIRNQIIEVFMKIINDFLKIVEEAAARRGSKGVGRSYFFQARLIYQISHNLITLAL